MPKLKVFLWKLCHASLPTKGTFLKRGLQIDPICTLFNANIEEVEHLFLQCFNAQKVWQLAKDHHCTSIPMPPVSLDRIQRWLSNLRANIGRVPFERIVALLWSIWKTPNSAVFRQEFPQPVVTLIRAKKASSEWRIRHKLTQSIQPPTQPPSSPNTKRLFEIAWKKPPKGFIKVNFDGFKSSHHAAGRYALRDWTGHLVQAGAFYLGAASILVAEATAMRNGLQVAVKAIFTNIHIEGDNKILIQALQGCIQPPWEIQVLVQDILFYLQKCNHVIVQHIFREGNRVPD